jgi:predicted RNA-binding protein with PUA-like domain
MAYWLVKSDPETYGLAELERDRRTVWDGVTNPVALKHIRAVKKGDEVLVYHTGDEKSVVGVGRAASDAAPDSKSRDSKLSVFDLEFVRRLPKPVSLAAIKADPRFADFALVRMSRLSVMPVPPPLWKLLLEMASAG